MATTGSFEKNERLGEKTTAALPFDGLIESNKSATSSTSARCIRIGPRLSFNQAIWLTSLAEHGKIDTVVTQNVSDLGARAVARKPWEPGELVLVSCPPGFSGRARIVYCQRLPSEDFVLGFRLVDAAGNWIISVKDRG